MSRWRDDEPPRRPPSVAEARPREIAAPAPPLAVLRGRSPPSKARRPPARPSTCVPPSGEFLALAAWSPSSQIRARVWTFDEPTPIDAAFFACASNATAARARHARRRATTPAGSSTASPTGCPASSPTATRHASSCSCSSAGADAWRDALVDALADAARRRCVVERSDAEVRALEGLAPAHRRAARHAARRGHAGRERGRRTASTSRGGQKTGFYLDQRDNRRSVADRPRRRAQRLLLHRRLHARLLAGGAAVVSDGQFRRRAGAGARESRAEPRARRRAGAPGAKPTRSPNCGSCATAGASFDCIVLDPPKFAPTAAHAERAARAYKDINLLALKMLRPGGLLATFSCSGGIDAALFRKIVAGAAHGRPRRRRHHRSLRRQRRSPGRPRLPRGRVPQGTAGSESRLTSEARSPCRRKGGFARQH